MYGLETIEWMNRPHPREREAPPKDPLEALSRKLLREAPPSIPFLITLMRDYEEFGEFVELVKEFLPEHERDILRQSTPGEQMARFADRFQDRYFPLADVVRMGDFESYADFTRGAPVDVHGFDYEDYEDIAPNGRPAVRLLTYLFEVDFVGPRERVSLAEACREHVPVELLERVPEGGFGLMLASQLLKGTRFEGALLWAQYINQDTGNYFLDTDEETYCSGYFPEWNKPTIENLTKQWQQMEKRGEDEVAFFEWLEADLPGRFEELLEIMLGRRDERIDDRQGKLPLIFAPVGAS